MLRVAIRSVLEQADAGEVEIIVVFDQVDLDPLDDVALPHARVLRTMANARTPGLAGARNTGILAARHPLVAFCDDDDEWAPTKLRRQLDLLAEYPDAALLATGIRIVVPNATHDRLPPERVGFDDLLASRITEIHPSSFLLRRQDLLGRLGLVDEALPASYGEDYDLLLRAARLGPVRSVAEPLTIVHWNRASFFAGRWQGISDGLTYLLGKHPEFTAHPRGLARIEGQIAFALAAQGIRSEARSWARSALRHDRRQLRAWAALLVGMRLAPASVLVRLVNRSGRGL